MTPQRGGGGGGQKKKTMILDFDLVSAQLIDKTEILSKRNKEEKDSVNFDLVSAWLIDAASTQIVRGLAALV